MKKPDFFIDGVHIAWDEGLKKYQISPQQREKDRLGQMVFAAGQKPSCVPSCPHFGTLGHCPSRVRTLGHCPVPKCPGTRSSVPSLPGRTGP